MTRTRANTHRPQPQLGELQQLLLRMTACEDVERIDIGSHPRVFVETDRFLARTKAKQPK